MNYETYKQITAIDGMNELKINADYELGGPNYFSGGYNRRGVYVYLKPLKRGDGFTQTMLLSDTASSGFKVFVKELSRKSDKTVRMVWDKVLPHADKIAELYNQRNFNEIVGIIENATASI